MKKLKLNKLSERMLDEKHINAIKGGDEPIPCSTCPSCPGEDGTNVIGFSKGIPSALSVVHIIPRD